jgi:hypothetical protein
MELPGIEGRRADDQHGGDNPKQGGEREREAFHDDGDSEGER